MRGTVCSIVGFFASFGANSTISYCAETSIVKILDFFSRKSSDIPLLYSRYYSKNIQKAMFFQN